MQTLPAALAAMADYAQFVLYRLVPSTDKPGKMDKEPVDWRTGRLPEKGQGGASIWSTFSNVAASASMFGESYGVGFSFAPTDPFWFLDIDGCLLPNNTWSPVALELCAAFPGAAVEVSQSGRGLHIFGSGAVPPHSCRNKALGLELYHEGRFAALTGAGAVGDIRTDHSTALAGVVAKYFTPDATHNAAAEWTAEPCAEWDGPSDDDELIRRMLNSKPSAASVFGGRATIVDLWDANVDALAASYPGDPYGASEADAALAAHLAFWTGRDCARIDRLMKRSALAREKYDREDYMERTILKACAGATTVYRERKLDLGEAPSEAEPLTHTGRLVEGTTFASPAAQLEMWRGFTYVTDANIILTATGQQLGPEQFRNRYGGNSYVMDNISTMSKNAWEVFTHSQAIRFPKVDHAVFRPDLEPSTQWERDGETFVNSYRRINVARSKGSVAPLLEHMEKVLPVERDRSILTAFMAAIVQYQGVKFQWAPLIQGIPGNGKSLFTWCVAEAVGWRYTHIARPAELAEKFNDWMVGKIFIGVEDIWYPEGRAEIVETLKPMITNKRLPIRAMRQSERTMDVCANFILNSNHKDALRKTLEDRRYSTMYCAQQEMEDLERDKMGKEYFSKLYSWLKNGGYANVTDFLHTYAIPEEFGLENCLLSRAPETSSTKEAILAGMGRIEQEVLEATLSGMAGFSGGWISASALDKLLRDRRMDSAMPINKRRAMLKTLGYDHHPSLRDGRLTSELPGTGEKPVLYIKKDHWARGLRTSAEIVKAFTTAQQTGLSGAVGAVVNG